MPGCPAVTGSVDTVATCGDVAPLGVDQVRCSARPETLFVIEVSTPLV